MQFIDYYILFYGVLALTHILFQMSLGHFEHRKQKSEKFTNKHLDHEPSVAVIVPVFNEDPILLDKCLDSITKQKYNGQVQVYVMDDGSRNQSETKLIYDKYQKNAAFTIVVNKDNRGKREVQKHAFDLAKSDILITVDSDTVIEQPNGIKDIVKQFKNPEVGAVTGDVRVLNKKKNFLTRLINYRYWTAFHQERAAQSLFNVVMCCSGPFSAYRASVIAKVKAKYTSQYFLGRKCTFGDDRHLTNLVLEEGYKVVFDNRAVAFTHVPENLPSYIKQQIRWNKSFYREMLWTLKHVHKHSIYMLYDLVLQAVLPFMLLIALLFTAYQALFVDISQLYRYLLLLIGIALLRSAYGLYRTKDLGFTSFIVYGFLHVLVLIPVRFYALLTLGVNKWGTR